ncbi:TonB-dependent receptor plug domain-containing protein [Parahaliea maris]|uniref:TonB-dependent receptor plug domain-containing protein n=1 Tax=Parahaliea maris TaxID=2716870 RepID=A0A5C8ZU09_9GAMM|nr:TonB-dependent receptor [Parahaliea maris]TXS91978.1 TonB-dependent receptor plug domain-containing protein [Parahaliea maris]
MNLFSGSLRQLLVAGGGLVFVAAQSGGAAAQEDSDNAQVGLEEVIITARKRTETVLEVPLSVQAFSADQIEAAGLTELESLATMTPNLDFQNMGNGQPGRFNPGIRFRGMEVQASGPTNQTGGFFVDGVPVAAGGSSVSFTDIARVEVIRGPQPVYFGRGTFGGAINYTTVDPGEEFSGKISAGYSPTFGSNDFSAYVEGTLVEDLTARFTVYSNTAGAPFTASDGGKLGEENTQGASLIFNFTPGDNLKVKARVAYSEDDDGAPSTTYVPFRLTSNTPAGTPISVLTTEGVVDTAFAKPWYVGDLPETEVDANSNFYNFVGSDGVFYNSGELLADTIAADGGSLPGPGVDGVGLRTDLLVTSLAIDYDLNDAITLSGLFGYNERETTVIKDSDSYAAPTWLTATGLDLESWTAEGRINYDNGGALRVMGGVNYASLDQYGDMDGGYNVFDGYFGTLAVGRLASNLEIATVETLGVFGSVEYDLFSWLTATAELRYQEDTKKDSSGWFNGTIDGEEVEQTFEDWLPRFILSATPFEGANLYVSYAESTLPGSKNNSLDRKTPEEKAEIAQLYGIETFIPKDELKAYELGWKQSLLDGNMWISAIGFYQEWEGMKSSVVYAYVPTVTPNNGPSFLGATVAGSSTQEGIELEANWRVNANLVVHGAYGYVKSEFDEFFGSSINSVIGLPTGTNYLANGKTLPRSPEHSAAMSATWTDQLVEDWDYYVRGDLMYRGETYTDELNLTTLEAYTLANLRLGIERDDGLMFELYCNNCADEEGWATGRRYTDLGENPNFFVNQGMVVDPITPREYGVRFSYGF